MALFHRSLPRTLPACLRDLSESDPLVRRSAIEDLGRFVHTGQDGAITQALMKGLEDSDALVRMHAAYDLGDAQIIDALPKLLMAVDDPHALVRQAAIDALGLLRDKRALARLQRALSDERSEMRFQALMALAKIDALEAEEAIVRAMKDSDPKVRYIAVRVAEEISSIDNDTVKIPEKLAKRIHLWVQDEDSRVRLAVAILLGRAGDDAGREQLVTAVDDRMVIVDREDEVAAIELVGKLCITEAVLALERRAFGYARWYRERYSWAARVALARMGHERAIGSILRDLHAWKRTTRDAAVTSAMEAGLVQALDRLEEMRSHGRMADAEALEAAISKLKLVMLEQ